MHDIWEMPKHDTKEKPSETLEMTLFLTFLDNVGIRFWFIDFNITDNN